MQEKPQHEPTTPLSFGNNEAMQVICRLYASGEDPNTPPLDKIDISILVYLISRRCMDHEIFDSQYTIAERTRVERKAVARSLKRLSDLGWITVGSLGPGRSKYIALNIDQFPAAQPVHQKVTDNAKKLAMVYHDQLKHLGCLGKRPKNWWKRQWPSAQNLIDRCDGDVMRAGALVNFAMHHPELKARARTSLYWVRCIWKKALRLYADAQKKEGESNEHQDAA